MCERIHSDALVPSSFLLLLVRLLLLVAWHLLLLAKSALLEKQTKRRDNCITSARHGQSKIDRTQFGIEQGKCEKHRNLRTSHSN